MGLIAKYWQPILLVAFIVAVLIWNELNKRGGK